MSKRILCTFGGRAYDRTTEITVRDAPRFGVDEVRVYDDAWLLQTEFFRQHSEWWSIPDTRHGGGNRGFGWFIWKPYIIQHALINSNPGDIVLCVDGDTYPIADLTPLYQECDRIGGMMFFEATGCNHANWCKRDCFIVMGQDEPRYRTIPNSERYPHLQHAVARFMLFRNLNSHAGELSKCPHCFLQQWQCYCLNRNANTFDASRLAPEYPELREHRCEQAILTNLCHKYGHKLYREACGFGESVAWDRELYGQLFVQEDCEHRLKHDKSGSKYRNV